MRSPNSKHPEVRGPSENQLAAGTEDAFAAASLPSSARQQVPIAPTHPSRLRALAGALVTTVGLFGIGGAGLKPAMAKESKAPAAPANAPKEGEVPGNSVATLPDGTTVGFVPMASGGFVRLQLGKGYWSMAERYYVNYKSGPLYLSDFGLTMTRVTNYAGGESDAKIHLDSVKLPEEYEKLKPEEAIMAFAKKFCDGTALADLAKRRQATLLPGIPGPKIVKGGIEAVVIKTVAGKISQEKIKLVSCSAGGMRLKPKYQIEDNNVNTLEIDFSLVERGTSKSVLISWMDSAGKSPAVDVRKGLAICESTDQIPPGAYEKIFDASTPESGRFDACTKYVTGGYFPGFIQTFKVHQDNHLIRAWERPDPAKNGDVAATASRFNIYFKTYPIDNRLEVAKQISAIIGGSGDGYLFECCEDLDKSKNDKKAAANDNPPRPFFRTVQVGTQPVYVAKILKMSDGLAAALRSDDAPVAGEYEGAELIQIAIQFELDEMWVSLMTTKNVLARISVSDPNSGNGSTEKPSKPASSQADGRQANFVGGNIDMEDPRKGINPRSIKASVSLVVQEAKSMKPGEFGVTTDIEGFDSHVKSLLHAHSTPIKAK